MEWIAAVVGLLGVVFYVAHLVSRIADLRLQLVTAESERATLLQEVRNLKEECDELQTVITTMAFEISDADSVDVYNRWVLSARESRDPN